MNIDINISSLSPDEFKKYKLIDIREPGEYATLPALTKKVAYIPFSLYPSNIDQFKKDESYLIFCAMGGRSHQMAAHLNNQGIKALSIVAGIEAVNHYLSNLPANER